MKLIRAWCVGSMALIVLLAGGVVLSVCDKAAAQSAGHGGEQVEEMEHGTEAGQNADKISGASPEALYYAIAITVGIACLSAGYAVGKVGAAALGAASERPEIMGRALIFVGLAEGIAIYGLIIGIMLIQLV